MRRGAVRWEVRRCPHKSVIGMLYMVISYMLKWAGDQGDQGETAKKTPCPGIEPAACGVKRRVLYARAISCVLENVAAHIVYLRTLSMPAIQIQPHGWYTARSRGRL